MHQPSVAGGLFTMTDLSVHDGPESLFRLTGIRSIYDEAMSDTQQIFPGEALHNDRGDAYRHCLASCEMTREYGATVAQYIGEANEMRGDYLHNQPCGERAMDRQNNFRGCEYGVVSTTKEQCQASCMTGLMTGALVISPAPGSGYLY